jgi:hypothetical protein
MYYVYLVIEILVTGRLQTPYRRYQSERRSALNGANKFAAQLR